MPLCECYLTWDYGWRWKIPTTDRLGNGYVFDSDFISVEDAEKEIRKRVDYKGPVRLIEFIPGRIEQVYYKNIVSLGLSSHFLEPLEATNLDNLSIFDKCKEEDMTWDSVATHWDSVAVPAYLRQKLEQYY